MDKRMTLEEAVAQIEDGATVVVGGSSISRKPMALIRAIARSSVRDLRLVVDVGGPDADLLIASGKVRELVYAYVGFEQFGLAPHFRRARQEGSLRFEEWTEYTVIAGLDAAVKRVPFLPTRAGFATDVLNVNPSFKVFKDPFNGEELVAVPAIRPDVALLHVNIADPTGNGVILGDGHIDELAAKAAKKTFLSAERVAEPEEVLAHGRNVRVLGIYVDGVIEAPWGAHPTACAPDYRLDAEALRAYLQAARDDEGMGAYLEEGVMAGEEAWIRQLGGAASLVERLKV